MARQIVWSPASKNDLEKILDYLEAHWGNKIVSVFITKIDNTISLIANTPQIFPVINKELEIRKCVITKQNTLYYRESNQKVEIVRLFDSRQDPKKLAFLEP